MCLWHLPTPSTGEVLRREPGFSFEAYLDTLHYRQPGDRARHCQSLLKAGLPA